MSEPKVEFFIDMLDGPERESFDQLRRWFEHREDTGAPTFQTFSEVLRPGGESRLYVPGVVYGYSGISEWTGGYWAPMEFILGSTTGRCYFGIETENTEGNFVKVLSHSSNSKDLKFRASVMYRDA